uniref:Uncharacterized protein n=1 Tax=Cucumis sativus TaxID=3659 RepID=A0A0A0LEZ6_CUCSA
MTFKSPATFSTVVVVVVVFFRIFACNNSFARFGFLNGRSRDGSSVSTSKFYPEKPNALFFRCRTDEGKLRERLDVHEIMSLSFTGTLVHESGIWWCWGRGVFEKPMPPTEERINNNRLITAEEEEEEIRKGREYSDKE